MEIGFINGVLMGKIRPNTFEGLNPNSIEKRPFQKPSYALP